jgi:lipopolysaccharide export system ATP-binding protein
LADKDISDRPRGLHRIKKGMMVSDNIELDFGMHGRYWCQAIKGCKLKALAKALTNGAWFVMCRLAYNAARLLVFLAQTALAKQQPFTCLPDYCPPMRGRSLLMDAMSPGMPIFQRARLGMGYLPQESSIFRGLTVEQNIRAVLETLEDHDDERDATLDDLMAEFGITHLRNTPSVSLSGGERRRLEIARALAARPTFLLLDEPLAGIDPIALGEIRDLIAHLKTHGIGVLITDHNVRETLDIVDRAYIIHDGTVLMEGTPDEVVQHSGVRQVYLGERFSI